MKTIQKLVSRSAGLCAALLIVPAAPALAASAHGIGPDAVVPDGAPLPASLAGIDAACDDLGLCGYICPSAASVFIGDFAYDQANNRFAVIDVVSPDGIFWMDGESCVVGEYGSFAGISQRGCAYDNVSGIVYAGGWNDDTIYRLDADFQLLGSQYFGEDYAGMTVDEDNNLLYASTNSDPDELIAYTINGDGSVTATGDRWPIPWGGLSDGYSNASLEYDECSQTFMAINQDANTMEYFQLDGGVLVNTGYCPLPVEFGWGFGLNFSSVDLKVADIASFSCNFPVQAVEPAEEICGGGEVPDFVVNYQELAFLFVGSGGGPLAVKVRNNTDAAAEKVLWLTAPRGIDIPLGEATSFPVGSSTFYTGVPDQDLPIPPGDYAGTITLGDQVGGAGDASTEVDFSVVESGVQ